MRGDGKSHKKLPLKRLDHSLTVGALSKSKKNQTIPGNNRSTTLSINFISIKKLMLS